MSDEQDSGLSPLDKKIIHELSGDLGTGPKPFEELGERLGISEDQVLQTIHRLRREGYLRRFGATLRHQQSGFSANAMVAWKVEDDRIDEVGEILASYTEVTHCYYRPPVSDWKYNIYSMIHCPSEDECRALAARMSEKTGIAEYELLFSTEELKKTSMRYFG
ncbi:MAG: AsnC family transcriptional regulator [Deltaproteobacteria bacterium]|nr:AsnC family transcriptional regulator [Deltaproteobacteria bacterium]